MIGLKEGHLNAVYKPIKIADYKEINDVDNSIAVNTKPDISKLL